MCRSYCGRIPELTLRSYPRVTTCNALLLRLCFLVLSLATYLIGHFQPRLCPRIPSSVRLSSRRQRLDTVGSFCRLPLSSHSSCRIVGMLIVYLEYCHLLKKHDSKRCCPWRRDVAARDAWIHCRGRRTQHHDKVLVAWQNLTKESSTLFKQYRSAWRRAHSYKQPAVSQLTVFSVSLPIKKSRAETVWRNK